MKALLEDRRLLRGEMRSLEKDWHLRLKEVGEEKRTLKIKLTEENRLMHKSYSAEVKKRELLEAKAVQLEAKAVHDNDKITNLKRANNQLMLDIRRERKVSNIIIDEAMGEARRLSADAFKMIVKANETILTERNRANQMIMTERNHANEMRITEHNKAAARLHKERSHHSRESERLRQKQAASIEKLQQEQASLVKLVQSKCDVKYHKALGDVASLSKKLTEQRLMWQTRLRDTDSSYKDHQSKERASRHNMIQMQIDESSAMECQLMEIITGLEAMNEELADEVKSAKKAKREAIRLYDKSKDDAARRLNQLRSEKEQKNLLKDELTRVLRAQQAQEAQLDKYKSMVETFQSSKRDLTLISKAGRKGGAIWPLWVTEVCCELLVSGSLPLAIPSSILTLFAALYGEEPQKNSLVELCSTMSCACSDHQ